jgi:uncharacterized RDD family membrane protein YckC
VQEAPGGLPGEVAGFGRRLGAIVIDWFASIAISLLLFRQVTYGSPESSAAILLIFATEIIVLTWLIGASFGQRLLGITVIRTDGTRLSLWRVIIRTLLICLVIPAVVYDSYGRGLHDRAVDSVAVRAAAGGRAT